MAGVKLSFKVDKPAGTHAVMGYDTADGAMYSASYRYECRGVEWWAVLESVEELMPPRTPQISSYTDADRVPMMDKWGYSAVLEAEQRKREWAEVNRG